MKPLIITVWLLRIIAAVILLQTLYFKFTAHPQSVYIFTTIGMEPWGRIGTGVLELVAALLLLYPRTTWAGALLSSVLMAGALFFHLTILGIKVDGDSVLFTYALITFACSLALVIIERRQIRMAIKPGLKK